MFLKKKSSRRNRSSDEVEGYRFFKAPSIAPSDETSNDGVRVRRDGTLYASVGDPTPVYQEVDESLDNLYHYARRDTEVRNIIEHIKSEKRKQEPIYVGMTPRNDLQEETDACHNSDEECTKEEDSDGDDGSVCSLNGGTNDKSLSYVTLTA